MLAIAQYDLRYESAKAIKAQVLAGLIIDHGPNELVVVEPVPWMLFFDGSICKQGSRIGTVLVSPRGKTFGFSYEVEEHTNNQVEYEAIMRGLQILREANVDFIEIHGDSLLIINQLAGAYECRDEVWMTYLEKYRKLLREFRSIKFNRVPREQHMKANDLAQRASGYRLVLNINDADYTEEEWRT